MRLTETSWAKRIEYSNGLEYTVPTLKKAVLDLALKACGTVFMYGLGSIGGEGANYIPHLNEWLPRTVDYIFSIDAHGNLDGLVSLLGAVYGFAKSGVRLDSRLEAKEFALPFPIKYKKIW